MSLGENSSTLVRQRTSNSRMVFLSTKPRRCMPRTPSCTAEAISLRYLLFFAITIDLRQFVSSDHDLDPASIERENHRAVILQIPFIRLADVFLFVLRKSK